MATAKTGLLILTQPVSLLKPLVPRVIEEATRIVNDTLYVCLQPTSVNKLWQPSTLQPVPCTEEIKQFVAQIYSGSNLCHSLDIRVLLTHICSNKPSILQANPYHLKKEVTVLLSDSKSMSEKWIKEKMSVTDAIKANFCNVSPNMSFHFMDFGDAISETSVEFSSSILKTYRNVVVGGTFDRLHTGHKLLLNECCMHCDNKLTIGITDGERNKKKSLWELMEPYTTREQNVVDFLEDVKPNIKIDPVQIFDPFGPTINDPDFDCLVVSEETKGGGEAVNTERQKRGFSELDLIVIDLVDDECRSADEEEKVSSSSKRKRLLGSLLKPLPVHGHLRHTPYRVAVTGGIASGKSNACSEMEKLGAKLINFDLLGHKAYEKGTLTHETIVKEFGNHIVDETGNIDRKKLGAIVFSDKSKLTTLNSIVWPAIRQLAEQEIALVKAEGIPVVVFEAAVLLEAGWQDMAHEVWCTFVPREEAVSRMMTRNNLSREEAEGRLNSQISNESRIAQSNVVLCPLWEYEVTRKQIQKAWDLMQERIRKCQPTAGNKL